VPQTIGDAARAAIKAIIRKKRPPSVQPPAPPTARNLAVEEKRVGTKKRPRISVSPNLDAR
jgi:hypothetical protein